MSQQDIEHQQIEYRQFKGEYDYESNRQISSGILRCRRRI